MPLAAICGRWVMLITCRFWFPIFPWWVPSFRRWSLILRYLFHRRWWWGVSRLPLSWLSGIAWHVRFHRPKQQKLHSAMSRFIGREKESNTVHSFGIRFFSGSKLYHETNVGMPKGTSSDCICFQCLCRPVHAVRSGLWLVPVLCCTRCPFAQSAAQCGHQMK